MANLNELNEKRMKYLFIGENIIAVMLIFLTFRIFHRDFGFNESQKELFQTIAAVLSVLSWPFLFPMLRITRIIFSDPQKTALVEDERHNYIRNKASGITLIGILVLQPVFIVLGIFTGLSMPVGACLTLIAAMLIFFNTFYFLYK